MFIKFTSLSHLFHIANSALDKNQFIIIIIWRGIKIPQLLPTTTLPIIITPTIMHLRDRKLPPGGPGKTKKEEIISVDVEKGISPTQLSTLTSKLNTKESNQKEP